MPPRNKHTYLAHVVPGLEELASEQLTAQLAGGQVLRVLRNFDERTSLLVFRCAAPPAELLELRMVEDVFVLAAETDDVPGGRSGLAAIRSAVSTSGTLEGATSAAMQVRPRRKGRVTFRVVARKAGQHAYRRVDVQRAVEQGILERFPSWRLVEDGAQLEVWVQLIGNHLMVGIRLSDNAMRQRSYRTVSLPAALKPTVAHAMVTLSDPAPDDAFLDPMCGSGTILIERALAGRYRCLLGGDADPAAVKATRENIGPRYKPIEIRQWDARALSLESGSVSALVTNLPFGKQIGTPEQNRQLYPALLKEWVRVLQPGHKMVLLTSERSLLLRSLKWHPDLVLERQMPVTVRGLPSAIFVLRRAS